MYPPTKKVPEGRRKKAVAKLFYTLTENNHKLYIFICIQLVFFLRPYGTWKTFYQYIPGLKPGAVFQRPVGAYLFYNLYPGATPGKMFQPWIKSRRDDRIQPGVLTPGISCIPPRKKSRRDAGKKLLQSYSTPSQKIIINYTFSSVARWYFSCVPTGLENHFINIYPPG